MMSMGVMEFLNKPVRAEQLVSEVRKYLNNKHSKKAPDAEDA